MHAEYFIVVTLGGGHAQPVEPRHADVEEHHVGGMLVDAGERLVPVGRVVGKRLDEGPRGSLEGLAISRTLVGEADELTGGFEGHGHVLRRRVPVCSERLTVSPDGQRTATVRCSTPCCSLVSSCWEVHTSPSQNTSGYIRLSPSNARHVSGSAHSGVSSSTSHAW